MNISVKNIFIIILIFLLLATLIIYSQERRYVRQVEKSFQQYRTKATKEKQLLRDDYEERIQQIKKEKDMLALQVTQLNQLLSTSETKNRELEELNRELRDKVLILKDEIRIWEGRIRNISELNTLKERKIKSNCQLRKNLFFLKQQLHHSRILAKKALNDLMSQLGNHGFLTKDGKSTFDKNKAIKLERIVIK